MRYLIEALICLIGVITTQIMPDSNLVCVITGVTGLCALDLLRNLIQTFKK